MVEMLISQTDDLVISAQHVELPDSFIIEIEAPKVSKLIQEFNNDFNFMANYLKIMNKRMVLLNPVSAPFVFTFSTSIELNERDLAKVDVAASLFTGCSGIVRDRCHRLYCSRVNFFYLAFYRSSILPFLSRSDSLNSHTC